MLAARKEQLYNNDYSSTTPCIRRRLKCALLLLIQLFLYGAVAPHPSLQFEFSGVLKAQFDLSVRRQWWLKVKHNIHLICTFNGHLYDRQQWTAIRGSMGWNYSSLFNHHRRERLDRMTRWNARGNSRWLVDWKFNYESVCWPGSSCGRRRKNVL